MNAASIQINPHVFTSNFKFIHKTYISQQITRETLQKKKKNHTKIHEAYKQ